MAITLYGNGLECAKCGCNLTKKEHYKVLHIWYADKKKQAKSYTMKSYCLGCTVKKKIITKEEQENEEYYGRFDRKEDD